MKTKSNLISKNPLGKNEGIFCLRKLLFSALIGLTSIAFSQAKIELKEPKKSFGIVKKGEIIKLEYDFTNIGNEPLIITDAEVSCSCTSVEFPKQPIGPNQKGKVIISFDTKTVYDRQDRAVLLMSNDPKSPTKIRYKGIVLRK